MDGAGTSGTMEVAMTVSGTRTKSMALASTSGQTVVSTTVNGETIICMDAAFIPGKTVGNMRAST